MNEADFHEKSKSVADGEKLTDAEKILGTMPDFNENEGEKKHESKANMGGRGVIMKNARAEAFSLAKSVINEDNDKKHGPIKIYDGEGGFVIASGERRKPGENLSTVNVIMGDGYRKPLHELTFPDRAEKLRKAVMDRMRDEYSGGRDADYALYIMDAMERGESVAKINEELIEPAGFSGLAFSSVQRMVLEFSRSGTDFVKEMARLEGRELSEDELKMIKRQEKKNLRSREREARRKR